MKISDGLFHKVFDEIAAEYPDIENESWIVDIGAAKMADTPEAFDVIVMPNLYGDILSDVAAQIAGSVGLAGSANIGDSCAMFEAIHGSAPRRAGQNKANPSGLLLGAVLMLVHIGQPDIAEKVHNAWLKTMEDGVHTYDIFAEGVSKEKVGTKEFAQAVIARLGQKPQTLKAVTYSAGDQEIMGQYKPVTHTTEKKELVGVDVYLEWNAGAPDQLGAALQQATSDGLAVQAITSRGARVWPNGLPETFTTDHWRARFLPTQTGSAVSHAQVVSLLHKLAEAGFDFVKTENLYTFDGNAEYSTIPGA
jgi:isocitrate dehydrogenase